MRNMRDILQRLARLEAENHRLRGELRALRAVLRPDEARADTLEPISRRELLTKVGGVASAAGLAFGTDMLGARPADASHAPGFGHENGTPSRPIGLTTSLVSSSSHALVVESIGFGGRGMECTGAGAGVTGISRRSGDGVLGVSEGPPFIGGPPEGYGVRGERSGPGHGVLGFQELPGGGAGVRGVTAGTNGVEGESNNHDASGVFGLNTRGGFGVAGRTTSGDRAGVYGENRGSGAGVLAISANGRGGVFEGESAQVHLRPSGAVTHPTMGLPGDLFVDDSARLWFCRGGPHWAQLA